VFLVDWKHKEDWQKKGEDLKNRNKLETKVILFRLQKSELQSRLTLTLRPEAAKRMIIQTMLAWSLLQKKAERASIYH
jgi:hypothetical protein